GKRSDAGGGEGHDYLPDRVQRPVSPADEKGNKDQFGQSKQDDGGGGNAVIGLDGFAVFVGRFGRFIEYGQAKACEIRGALAKAGEFQPEPGTGGGGKGLGRLGDHGRGRLHQSGFPGVKPASTTTAYRPAAMLLRKRKVIGAMEA